ncbi:MAG: hypothetical protein ABSB40_13920 [Nitrososphaeria archaeon]
MNYAETKITSREEDPLDRDYIRNLPIPRYYDTAIIPQDMTTCETSTM